MHHVTRSAALVAMGALIFSALSWTPAVPAPDAEAAIITQPVRVRMDLDTRNLYLYQDSATATTRLKDSAVSGLNANTWLDLSHAANNKAGTDGTYCLAVNNNGYTVYVNQDGPVVSCANQTPTSKVLIGEARSLTEPDPSVSFSNSTPTIGTSFTASAAGSNISRREWILPDGTSQTAATTPSLSYNTTGARSFTLRAVGTKGERVVTSSVAPVGFTLTVTARGGKGGSGGSGYNGSAGSAGSNGDVASGSYLVTSLPLSLSLSGLGSSTNGGNGGAGSGGSAGTGGSSGSTGSGYTSSSTTWPLPTACVAPATVLQCQFSSPDPWGTTNPTLGYWTGLQLVWNWNSGFYEYQRGPLWGPPAVTTYTYYGSGGGGGAGRSPAVSIGGSTIIRAKGGAGGAGGTAYYAGGAGGAAAGSTTHSGLSGFTSSAGGWTSQSSEIVLSAPAIGLNSTYTSDQTVTLQ